MVEEQLVEFGADDLEAVLSLPLGSVEAERPLLAAPPVEGPTLADESVPLDRLTDAQDVQHRQQRGQQRLPDVIPREAFAFQQHHVEPLPREQPRGRRPRRSAAGDHHMPVLTHAHFPST